MIEPDGAEAYDAIVGQSDLIERLLRYESWNADTVELMHDAADRIAELEAQVHSNQASSMRSAKAAERLQEKLDVAEACIAELEAENARLREAVSDHYCELVERGKGRCKICEALAEKDCG